jgi:hypothetical protein
MFHNPPPNQRSWGASIEAFRALPGLRGLWTADSADSTGAMTDRSGQGRNMTYNGNPTLNVYNSLVGYWDYDGTGDYHSLVDSGGLDITGTETIIASAIRGLTMGGWFWIDASATRYGFMGKNVSAGQASYDLWVFETGTFPQFRISGDGTNVDGIGSTTALTANAWHFLVGKYIPSTSVNLYQDGTKFTNSTGVDASIFNSTSAFEIGRFTGGSALNGRCALAFLCASALPDDLLDYLLFTTRGFFGA